MRGRNLRREGNDPSLVFCNSTLIAELCIVLYFSNGNGCCRCARCGEQSYGCASGRQMKSDVLREAGERPSAASGRLRHGRMKIYGPKGMKTV